MMFEFLKRIFGQTPPSDTGRFDVNELARRLGLTVEQIRAVPISYTTFQIPKRSGRGSRTTTAPNPELETLQRTILRRLLKRLKSHACATGFEPGHSIVTNALPHVGRELVIRLDVKEFFASTSANRVEQFFQGIGWNREAARLLTSICTHDGGLPQGAPTSPRLSNLVNYLLDVRLQAVATTRGLAYTRYADDITFSGDARKTESNAKLKPHVIRQLPPPMLIRVNDVIHIAKDILEDFGYRLHTDRKLRIAHRHDRQIVTGIVVNDRANLPRTTRRWLRAVRHRAATKGNATLTEQQIAGWSALEQMVATQSAT